MKILKYTVLSTLLAFSSCGKGFLEVEPIGQLGREQLFSNPDGVRDALNGSYSLVTKFMLGQNGIYGDLRADDVIRLNSAVSTLMLNDYNYIFNQEDVFGATMNIWANGYETLNNINNVIQGSVELKSTHLNTSQLAALNKYESEAYILRGLMFLMISNVYAQHYTYTSDASHLGIPLPLTTPAPGEKLPRATMKDTYAQIIADLKKGIEGLSSINNEKIFASADAAKGLLSRVYLYMGDYDNAVQSANQIINTNQYMLVPASEYLDMYISNSQRTNFQSLKSEVLWQLNLSNSESASNVMAAFYSGAVSFSGSPSYGLLSLLTNDDVRRQIMVDRPEGIMSRKYHAYTNTPNHEWPVNYKVIRSAEVILNRAEAYYKQQKYELAVADIKTIRARALNKSPEDIVITYATPEELFTLIKNERRKELSFEGHRIYDLMRYKESVNRGADCNAGMCTITYPNDIFVLPIPKTELDANELIKPNPTVNN